MDSGSSSSQNISKCPLLDGYGCMDGKEIKSQLQLFEGRKVRTVWDEEAQE